MVEASGIGPDEYRRYCEALEVEVNRALSPVARQLSLPSWICDALIASADAIAKLRAFKARPTPSPQEIALRFRCAAGTLTVNLLGDLLASGRRIPPPVAWFVLEHIMTVAVGRSCLGVCLPAPGPRVTRMIIVRDDLPDVEVQSLFLHECAHAWLFPPPLADVTPLEEALSLSPALWGALARHDLVEEQQADEVRNERQACALARRWGAVGLPADGVACARGSLQRSQAEVAAALARSAGGR